MNRLRTLFLLLAACSILSCAPREGVLVRTIDPELWQAAWKGQPREVVEDRWGSPSAVERMATGETLLRYESTEVHAGGPYISDLSSSDVAIPTHGYDVGFADVGITTETRALFRIGEDGRVTGYWINPELRERDVPRVPAIRGGGG